MVVDDLLLIRMLARRYLEPAGDRVIQATNGADAVALYQERQPGAVLADLSRTIENHAKADAAALVPAVAAALAPASAGLEQRAGASTTP